MKPIVWILGVSLAAFLTLGVVGQESAQAAVINSVAIDTNGDLPGFLELFKRSQAIAKRLGNPAPRVFQATLAGAQTNDIVISTEHASLVALAQAQAKTQADAEWQKLIEDAGNKGISATSNSVANEITPDGAPEAARGNLIQYVGLDTNGNLPARHREARPLDPRAARHGRVGTRLAGYARRRPAQQRRHRDRVREPWGPRASAGEAASGRRVAEAVRGGPEEGDHRDDEPDLDRHHPVV